MTVTIEIPPELEARLSALAAAQGLAVPQYVQHLIVEQLPIRSDDHSSRADRVAAWEDVKGLPLTPLLSDAAISREAMYGPRG